MVTALNANALFAANFIASTVANRVTVKSLRAGADIYIKVTSTLSTAFGASGQEDQGSDADYVILDEYVDTKDTNGAAVTPLAVGWPVGDFLTTNLRNLTAEAKATMMRQGSFFRDSA